jgi:hypothetical protein
MKRKEAWEEAVEAVEADAPRADFHPSIEWLAAFRSQFNDALVALSVEYANELDAGIGSDKQKSKRYPRAVVLRALTDAHVGVLRWDHTTSLKEYIEHALQTRLPMDWKRAQKRPERRFRHLRIDERTASGRSYAQEEIDRLVFERLTDREKAREGLAELLERAAAYPDLAEYIEARCYEASRAEVVRDLQLSPERYRQLARQLGRLIKQLSIEARPQRDSEKGKP